MSKRKQDDGVDSSSEKRTKTTELNDSNPKGSTFVVTVVNDSIQGMQEWTEEETALLKQAVEVDGGQFNWETIASAVPAKDMNQVKTYVLSMVSQPSAENQTNQSANVIKAPIEIWTDLAQKLTSDEDKAAAVCIPQLMVAAAAEPVNAHKPGCPNYGQIYLYLSSLLKGETPHTLPPLESSVVLSLIQQIVNKIKTSELSGQLNFLASFYKSFLSSNTETNENGNPGKNVRSSTVTDHEKAKAGYSIRNKQSSDSEASGTRSGNYRKRTTAVCKTPETVVRRTSSGRVVRQRFQLVMDSEDDEDDEDEQDDEGQQGTQSSPLTTQSTTPVSKPRPTSLNPFRVPVNLLNFKQAQNKNL